MSNLGRWRLVLGRASHGALGTCEGEEAACESALSWLYDRDENLAERGIRQTEDRTGGLEGPNLTTVDWIESIHKLFPQETIERLEQDAVEIYEIDDLVTNPKVLERVKPNQALLKAVLKTKHLMNQEVLAMAKALVKQVVEELLEKLKSEFQQAFSGSLDRRRSSPVKSARNFDFKRTLRHNLRNVKNGKLTIERAFFHARVQRLTKNWQVILLVDQSGSMLDSVIHSAVTASCLWSLPGISTHLCVFSTEVVDLTKDCVDPVETLMKVQLGGGTDIGTAVAYAQSMVRTPRETVVVIISDFYEGGSTHRLVQKVRQLCANGTTVLGLAALDQNAKPDYDRETAKQLVQVGAQVGAMTPGELAAWLAEKIR